MKKEQLQEIKETYLECALWSSLDLDRYETEEKVNNIPLDQNYCLTDFSKATIEKSLQDIEEFVNRALLIDKDIFKGLFLDQVGHWFWLSRNGHGSGFFDLSTERGDMLQELSREFKEVYFFHNNGKLEIM